MGSSIGSSLVSVVFALVVCGACAAYYMIYVRKMMSPEARAAAFAAAGYRQGETNRTYFGGSVLVRGPNESLSEAVFSLYRGNFGPQAVFSFTTHDRVLAQLEGVNTWFEGPVKPQVRLLGRVMLKDTTGVFDALASQTETTIYFVPDGQPLPAGATPKRGYNMQSTQEDIYVVEVTLPNRPPLAMEMVESGVIALCQWAQGGAAAPGFAPPQQPHAGPQAPQGYPQPHPSHPPQGYAQPPQGYAQPPQGYAPPQQGYAPPQQGFAPPPPHAHAQPPYPAPGYGAPQPYGQPQAYPSHAPPTYPSQPPPGYPSGR